MLGKRFHLPRELDFWLDQDDELIIDQRSDRRAYEKLSNLTDNQWENFLDIMASRGITVEYDSIDDFFVLYT